MVDCARILEAAGDKGVLKTRNLEQIKKIKSAKSKPELKVKAAAAKAVVKKISTTGISVPNFVNGEPADPSVGVQMLQAIADQIDDARVADLAKRNVVCPFPNCPVRWTDAKYMEPHFAKKHQGHALSMFLPSPSPSSNAAL
jgi:hypothetical protein